MEKIRELAYEIARFCSEYDIYEYRDTCNDFNDLVDDTENLLSDKWTRYYVIDYLKDILNESPYDLERFLANYYICKINALRG